MTHVPASKRLGVAVPRGPRAVPVLGLPAVSAEVLQPRRRGSCFVVLGSRVLHRPHNVPQGRLGAAYEGGGDTLVADSASPADAVHVVVRILRQLVVDDVID